MPRELCNELLMNAQPIPILVDAAGGRMGLHVTGGVWILIEQRLEIRRLQCVNDYVPGRLRRIWIFRRSQVALDADYVSRTANIAEKLFPARLLPERNGALLDHEKERRIGTGLPA